MSYFDDASLAFLPSGAAGKDGKAYSIKPTDGDGDFDFSRGSNLASTRINSDGLIEKGRENLLLQSNQFDTTWTTTNATLTSGQSGYDGSLDAWELQSSGGTNWVVQLISNNGIYTFSVYAKSGTTDWMRINILQSGGNANNYYDIANGLKGASPSSAIIDDKIESVGNGWYRISIVSDGSITQIRIQTAVSDGNETSVSGDNIYIQSAQLEIGLVSTDYITSGATKGKAGILENTPRFNYGDGASCPSVLLEPSRTNIQPYSEYLESSFWSKTDISLDFGYLAPDGTNSAYKLTKTGTNAHIVNTTTTGNSGNIKSIYAKTTSGTGTIILFNSVDTYFTITEDWQRFDLLHDGLDFFYACDFRGTSTLTEVLLWGAQSEAGSYATSYIPTYGIIETRAADATSGLFSGKNIFDTSWTAFCELVVPYQGSAGVGAGFAARAVEGSTSTTYWNFALAHGNGELVLNTYSPSTTVSIAYNFGDKIKIAVRSDGNYFVNGIKYAIAGMITAEPVELGFGRLGNSGFSSGETAKINQTLVFPTALTDAECIALTTI